MYGEVSISALALRDSLGRMEGQDRGWGLGRGEGSREVLRVRSGAISGFGLRAGGEVGGYGRYLLSSTSNTRKPALVRGAVSGPLQGDVTGPLERGPGGYML